MTDEQKLRVLNRFRTISIMEGISLVVLLFIAMPLKYVFDLPLMVKYVGWAHGILFIVYVLVLFPTSRKLRWSFRTAVLALIASLIPFGPFLFDRKLKSQKKEIESGA